MIHRRFSNGIYVTKRLLKMKEVINVSDVCYKAKDKTIVDGVSFSVNSGDTFALLGENGSGKSTLINLILNDLKANSGSVRFFGKEKSNFKQLGILYDHLPLFPMLKVFEVIRYFSAIHKLDYKAVAGKYFEPFEINKISNSFIKALSQGERKRVGLLLSVMHKPSLLILDEPFANLDPTIIDRIWKILKKDKRTVFLTTHNWTDIERFATKVAFIFEGKLITETKSPEESIKSLPADKKVIISNSIKINGKLDDFDFYYHDDELHIFFDKKNEILNIINEFTNNFTVQDVGLKDAYLYHTTQHKTAIS